MNRLLLLKAAAVNAPILNHYNIPIPPLAFVQKDNQTVSRLTSMLSLPPLAVSHIEYTTPLSDVQRILDRHNLGVIFVYPEPHIERSNRSSRQQDKIESILDGVDFQRVNALVIFVFEGKMPDKYRDLSYLRIHDVDFESPLLQGYPVPEADQIQLALDKYGQIAGKITGYEWLYMSAALLYSVMLNVKKEDLYPDILQEAHEWALELEQLKNYDMLIDRLIESISSYIEALDSADFYRISGRVELTKAEIEAKVCIKGAYLYFTYKQLEAAIRDDIEGFDLMFALELLRDSDILRPDKGKGFQAQMIYYAAGEKCRPYRLRFHIGSLFSDGIPDRFTNGEDESIEGLYDR